MLTRGVPGVIPIAAFSVASKAPIGKPPPNPLANHHDIRRHIRPFIGPELPGTPHTALNFVENQQ